jgi:uncharacterized protein YcbX
MDLSEINIYPVKSLKRITLKEAVVEDRGLRNDRRWMLVDDSNRFLTQREFPVMARLEVKLDTDRFTVEVGDRSIEVSLDPGTEEYRTTKIWSSSVRAEVYPGEINAWFSEALGVNCSLVAMPEGAHRAVNPFYAVRRFKDTVSFADGYPFMIIGQASLDDLNSRLQAPVPMNRFRPNFVVTGSEPFAEDFWKVVRIGSTVFHVVKPCERCVMPTIDQSLGEKTGKEPLRTLGIFRTFKGKILFGQNLIAESAGGVVKVGDKVEVLERAKK